MTARNLKGLLSLHVFRNKNEIYFRASSNTARSPRVSTCNRKYITQFLNNYFLTIAHAE